LTRSEAQASAQKLALAKPLKQGMKFAAKSFEKQEWHGLLSEACTKLVWLWFVSI
jgi:hypothetical protein